MTKNFDKLLSSIFIALCAIAFILSVKFILANKKWSPIDEYAHMDYIEKLELGIIPKISDTIVSEIVDDILNNPQQSHGKPFHQRSELGYAINSYQAKHPPLYYALLVFPNYLLKKMGLMVFDRLLILRVISFLMFVIGSFLCFPILNLLKRLNYKIPIFYGWLYVLFALSICTHLRYGLGNNLLSPLLINGSIYFLLRYLLLPSENNIYCFLILFCLSLFTALTNILLAPFFIALILPKYFKHFSRRITIVSLCILLVFALLFLYWKKQSVPDKSFEENMYKTFGFNMPAGLLDFKTCVIFFLNDVFELSFLKKGMDISFGYLVLTGLNLTISLLFFKTLLKKNEWLLYAYIVFLVFILEFYLLNEYVGVVTWVVFRHYLGFIPFLFIGATGCSVVLYNRFFKD